jgi:hypothetical protein
MIFPCNDCDPTVNGTSLTVFASDLGLPPGEWPRLLRYASRLWHRTELCMDRDHDVTHATYGVGVGTATLTVYND